MKWSWYEHECLGGNLIFMSTNVRGGNLMWARMSGVVIWCEHECPGWSFDVSTNVRPCQKSHGNECPWERMSGIQFNRIHVSIAATAFLHLWTIVFVLHLQNRAFPKRVVSIFNLRVMSSNGSRWITVFSLPEISLPLFLTPFLSFVQ